MKYLLLIILLIFSSKSLFAKAEVLAKIPEASGIAYSKKTKSLYVVNDEGLIYELNKKGKILRKKNLGNYDLEAIAIDEKKNLLLLANEKKDEILVLNINDFSLIRKIKIKGDFKGNKIIKKGSDGIEGLALYKNKIYASNQSEKPYPKSDSSVIVILDYKLKIKDIIDPKYDDISGLTFHNDYLYFLSDKNNLLVKYDIKKAKVLKKYKIPKKHHQEGVCFDEENNLYIADDKGKIIKMMLDE